MKTSSTSSKKIKIFESIFIVMLCAMVIFAALMIADVKKQIEANGIEIAENSVNKAENLLTTDILSDKSLVKRYGNYIDWEDQEQAIKTMQSFIGEYEFSFGMYMGADGQGYDQDGNPLTPEDIPFEATFWGDGEVCFTPFYEDGDGTYMTAIVFPVIKDGSCTGYFYVGLPAEKYSISARLDSYIKDGVTYILDISNKTMVGSVLDSDESDVSTLSLAQFLENNGFSETATREDVYEKIKNHQKFNLHIKQDSSYQFYIPVEGYHGWYVCGSVSSEVIRHESDNVLSLIKGIIILAIVLTLIVMTGVSYIIFKRRSEERLQAEKNEMENAAFDALSETSDSVLCIFDVEKHRMERVFRNSMRILGRDSQEYQDNPQLLKEICELASTDLYQRIMDSRIQSDESWQIQLLHAVTGERLDIRFTIKQGIIIAGKKKYMFYWEDITQSVEIEESLRRAAFAAEQANRSKSEFLSNMSHEIRTPMNAILGMMEIMEHNVDNPLRLKDSIRKIKISANHLLNIINDILDLSRIESGKIQLNNQKFSLSELIDNVLNIIEVQADAKGHTFAVHSYGLQSDMLMGDWTRLHQILINILNNAVKYTKDGGRIDLEITEVEAVAKDFARFRFVVTDNGIGMSPEFIEHHLGTPFEQEQTEVHIREGGTGLGLSIVYNIVKMMDGTIDIRSRLNQGTRIIIELELERADEVDSPHFEELAVTDCGEKALMPGRKRKVLLAEDNELNREIASEFLKIGHIDAEPVENGQAAVDRFLSSAPGEYDVILMDLQMPVKDGLTATREIRQSDHAQGKTIPIIAMTANAFEEDIRRCLEAGMDAHLAKPIDLNRMLAVIDQATLKINYGSRQYEKE